MIAALQFTTVMADCRFFYMLGDVLNAVYVGAGGAGGQGWGRGFCVNGTVANGTVVQLAGLLLTVSAAGSVRAVGVGAAVLGCWGCAWF